MPRIVDERKVERIRCGHCHKLLEYVKEERDVLPQHIYQEDAPTFWWSIICPGCEKVVHIEKYP